MSSIALRFAKLLRVSAPSSSRVSLQRNSKMWYYRGAVDSDNDDQKIEEVKEEFDDYLGEEKRSFPKSQLQGVNVSKKWSFHGVHKAIICGKVKNAPVQKRSRKGRTVTFFSVGTGGLFDQRIVGENNLQRPVQWHKIVVHDDSLGAYAVQQLSKNSSVYVEGDIETLVNDDSINDEVKTFTEIHVRCHGAIHLIKSGESISNKSFEDLRERLV